jgi:hypothetical protein
MQVDLLNNLFLVVQPELEGQGANFQEKLIKEAVDARQGTVIVPVWL